MAHAISSEEWTFDGYRDRNGTESLAGTKDTILHLFAEGDLVLVGIGRSDILANREKEVLILLGQNMTNHNPLW